MKETKGFYKMEQKRGKIVKIGAGSAAQCICYIRTDSPKHMVVKVLPLHRKMSTEALNCNEWATKEKQNKLKTKQKKTKPKQYCR